MKKSRDLYRILGIRPNSSQETILKAYRRKAKRFHPDHNPGDTAAEAEFHEVQNAFEILSDPARRANYDATGNTSKPHGSLESDLINILHPIMMQVIQEVANNPYGSQLENVNVHDKMLQKMSQTIVVIEKNVQDIKKAHKNITIVKDRLTIDASEEDLLKLSLQSQLDNLDKSREGTKAELEKFKIAYAYLKKYKYRMDGSPGTASSISNSFPPFMLRGSIV